MEKGLFFGLHQNISFRDKNFKKLSILTFKIFLNEEEIKKIEEINLFDKDLRIARDYFLLAYYSGQRISDVMDFGAENIYMKEFLRFYVNKTGNEMQIPMHKKIKEIFEIYEGVIPMMQPNKINKALKEIGKLVGLNQIISFQEERGGKKNQVKKRKFELITTHTARRSLITNLHLKGISISNIMAISGHKTESSLIRYIRSSASDRAEELKKLDFFN
jgi:integrase